MKYTSGKFLKKKALLMSHSVPSDSSTADTSFLVGADLVQFVRHDLPLYLTPETGVESHWAGAGHDAATYGLPADRLFGEPGEVFVSMILGADEAAAITSFDSIVDDPVVTLGNLVEALILPASEQLAATFHDFSADALPLHDTWAGDLTASDWIFDTHA